jgi:PAS domain S-box-containing protein
MTGSGTSASGRLDRESFELIAESIPHIVWLADADGSGDYFNTMGTHYTGLPRQATYGWRWLELVHPDDLERARLGWEHATQSVTPFELSYRIRRSDGEFRWHAFRALPVRGPTASILRWIGTADDLDDLTQPADDAARVGRQVGELRAMLEAAQPTPSERFGYVDHDRRVARVNDVLAAARDGRAVPSRPTADGSAPDRTASADSAVEQLMPREVAVVRLVAAGYTNAEIANVLARSLRSVEASRARLRLTLGIRTRAELVRFAHETGLRHQDLDPPS